MDPQLSGSIERLLTFGIAYLLARQSANVQGLGPDITAVILAAGSAGWGWYKNRASSILTTAAKMPEVKKIELTPSLSSMELDKVTPSNVVVGNNPKAGG